MFIIVAVVGGVVRLSPASAAGSCGVLRPGPALSRITAKSVRVCLRGDLLVRLFMAEAVISRPGPQEPEKGLPGSSEDNRSAERGATSHGPGRCPLVETRERSIGGDPRGTIVAILRGACLYFPPFVRVSVSSCNRLPRWIKKWR